MMFFVAMLMTAKKLDQIILAMIFSILTRAMIFSPEAMVMIGMMEALIGTGLKAGQVAIFLPAEIIQMTAVIMKSFISMMETPPFGPMPDFWGAIPHLAMARPLNSKMVLTLSMILTTRDTNSIFQEIRSMSSAMEIPFQA